MCDWNWNTIWTAMAAIGTVGTLIMLVIPKFNNWRKIRCFNRKLEDFYKHYEGQEGKNNESYLEIKCFNDSNFKRAGHMELRKPDDTWCLLQFHKVNRIVKYTESPKLKLNYIHVPHGYAFYKTISDDCIEIEFNDSCANLVKKAFIHRYNNITQDDSNKEIFNKIIAWGKEK